MRSMCASNYHNNYWNHIVYKRYEERIIKQRAGIPAQGENMDIRSGPNERRDDTENVGRTGAKRRTDGQTDTLQTVSDWSQRVNPITHRKARFIVWTGDWLRVPAHDGGSHSLRWPWARNESGDRGGAICKVSCGFTHPIIKALKRTLAMDTTEKVLLRRKPQNRSDRIYGSALANELIINNT